MTNVLLRLMAPILSFTAEEAWEIHHGKDESVFFHTWKDVLPRQEGEKELRARWERLREIRAVVVKKLEELRAAGEIGSSLQAEVKVEAGIGDQELLRDLGDDLKFLFITSKAEVGGQADEGMIKVAARPSSAAKCERCWHWRDDVGAERRHAAICGRCVSNLEGPGEVRKHA